MQNPTIFFGKIVVLFIRISMIDNTHTTSLSQSNSKRTFFGRGVTFDSVLLCKVHTFY